MMRDIGRTLSRHRNPDQELDCDAHESIQTPNESQASVSWKNSPSGGRPS
jgi:hypothetical protein